MDLRDAATTPIIPGFFPDPTICRVGDEVFVANSSFEYSPGVPLWRSTDLVTWHEAGNALDDDPAFVAGDAAAGGGVYAPTLRHHDGRFWMITTNVSGAPGQLVSSAPAIEGPWGPARVIEGIRGIDPDLAWDDDGTCLGTYSSNDPDVPGIAQVRVDLDRGVVVGAARSVMAGTGLAYPEGPHVFRRGHWWYLLFAEGGTERGHCVSVARGPAASGPFDLCPANPILTRRSTTFPVQNTGHADMVELADGTWAMVYLGVRPRGATPLFHVNGRETFLAGIDWVDDWPVVVPDRYRVPFGESAFTDRFGESRLHPRWISPGAAPGAFATTGDGLELRALDSDNGAPALLSVRARDPYWQFTAVTDARDGAALRVRMDERHWYELRIVQGRALVHAQIGPVAQEFPSDERLSVHGNIELWVGADAATTGGPDDLVFGVRDASGIHEVIRLDGRYLSTEVAGGFVGRVIGLRADGQPVRFAEVRYEPVEAR
ncbi:glycoside hydrolase family 43 protein [Microbacterium protaetiae]|uniref:Glycoside hydrolase family 43 protein n=1 Tax=Microbacterium protaetiae TaxID=2509458 RepID=A0A4P6ED74_9MICO|nr:glycoside hydrolase family 43 protein [Microbacterium protaetiae]QAY60200.1 glycoside hydrolase family 43 protein [Microbacterium protaetiae]